MKSDEEIKAIAKQHFYTVGNFVPEGFIDAYKLGQDYNKVFIGELKIIIDELTEKVKHSNLEKAIAQDGVSWWPGTILKLKL